MVRAEEPSVVTLLFFRGVGLDNAIRLEWATGTEFHTVGFRVERSSSSVGPFVLLDEIGFVASEAPPDGLSGAEYEVIDSSGISNGTTYWYRLVEIEGSGAENRSNPISIMSGFAAPTSISTPISTPTRTPTTSSTAGSRSVPGSSPTPVSTGQSGTGTNSPPTPTHMPPTDRRLTPNSVSESASYGQSNLTPVGIEGSLFSQIAEDTSAGQSKVTGYPGPETLLSTPIPDSRIGAEGYPGLPQESDIGMPDAYPSSIESARPERVQNPRNGTSSAEGSVSIGQGNSPESEFVSEPSNQDPAATLMLWVGFLAALVIFIAAVIGSAYIYRRQSPK
ncbi:MAG TPA: hypothetical protein VFI27_05020 [candidate division Zixibacteria bacterium]|nr:hypothetical protein [candidate division Zixibacteria bacterium]